MLHPADDACPLYCHIHTHQLVYSLCSFCITTGELNRYKRYHRACKTEIIHSMALCRTILPLSDPGTHCDPWCLHHLISLWAHSSWCLLHIDKFFNASVRLFMALSWTHLPQVWSAEWQMKGRLTNALHVTWGGKWPLFIYAREGRVHYCIKKVECMHMK